MGCLLGSLISLGTASAQEAKKPGVIILGEITETHRTVRSVFESAGCEPGWFKWVKPSHRGTLPVTSPPIQVTLEAPSCKVPPPVVIPIKKSRRTAAPPPTKVAELEEPIKPDTRPSYEELQLMYESLVNEKEEAKIGPIPPTLVMSPPEEMCEWWMAMAPLAIILFVLGLIIGLKMPNPRRVGWVSFRNPLIVKESGEKKEFVCIGAQEDPHRKGKLVGIYRCEEPKCRAAVLGKEWELKNHINTECKRIRMVIDAHRSFPKRGVM